MYNIKGYGEFFNTFYIKEVFVMAKREGYISWDEFFMGAAVLCAKRSKDPNTQVGACIVNNENRILSVGYNGFPSGCDDDNFPWDRSAEDSYDTKYPYVCHAELNAILNSRDSNLDGCRIYVALFPCNECAKAIIQSGIREVVYISDKYAETESTRASKRMFEAAGVKLTKLTPNRSQVMIDFSEDKI
jgi:dCMP deaminase